MLALVVTAAILSVPMLSGCGPKETEADLINTTAEDAAVNAAKLEGAKTLPVFWAKFDAKDPATSDYVVKLAMKAKGGGVEFIWAEPISHTADEVAAKLLNDPVYLAGVQYGSIVHVPPDLIVDWSYTKNGKLYGHYTTRALMKNATPEQRAEVEGKFSPTPMEPGDH